MKLYYITDAKMPTEKAHGYQISKMCEEFGELLEVELVIPGRKTHIREDLFEFYGLEKIFSVRELGDFNFVKWERYLGWLTFYTQKIWFLYGIYKLDLEKDCLVYTRDIEIVWFLGKKHRVVYEAHNFSKKKYIYKYFLKNVYKIICITQGLKNEFIKFGFDGENILVAPDGVDMEKFQITNDKLQLRKELNLPLDKKIIMYVGSFYKWKGVDVLVKAAKLLPQYNFIFVGDGFIEDLPKNVLLVGRKKHKDVSKWMKSADVLVLPNSGEKDISRFYTSPIKMFEYMASGVPIVASDLPSIREVLSEEMVALVKPDNPREMVRGIEKVLENEEESQKRTEVASREVRIYTWRKRAEDISSFIFLR